MHELTNAEMVVKPPSGKHSVKGVGMTTPDPNYVKTIHEKVEVPVGKGVKSNTKSTLLYNEYPFIEKLISQTLIIFLDKQLKYVLQRRYTLINFLNFVTIDGNYK